jgi:hypothetical protein
VVHPAPLTDPPDALPCHVHNEGGTLKRTKTSSKNRKRKKNFFFTIRSATSGDSLLFLPCLHVLFGRKALES